MKLYHFTAVHLADKIKTEGITLGGYINRSILTGQMYLTPGYLWVTTNPVFDEQEWSEGKRIKYDRAAARFTVEIPADKEANIIDWLPFCNSGQIDTEVAETLNSLGDPQNWRLYRGTIPVEWITDLCYK